MPALATIRSAIVTTLSGVAGVGVVHDRERIADRNAEIKALYLSGGRLLGWFVRRIGTEESQPAVGRYVVTHRWRIRGYMGFDDADSSEILFDTIIEAIRDAFRSDETLGGVVATTIVGEQAGVQVGDSGPVLLAGILAHSARLDLATRHYQ